MKKQHYMTYEERLKLESYLQAGMKVAWIAEKMGFCKKTIYNEIKRGEYKHTYRWWDENRYSADIAQKKATYNQSAKGRPLKIGNNFKYAEYLEELMLKKRFSPAAALAEARKKNFDISICVTTLYTYIEKRVFATITKKTFGRKVYVKKEVIHK